MFADLHIHSRYSYATSKKINIPNLANFAANKGINLLASSDISHTLWREELNNFLVYNEHTGFYDYKYALEHSKYSAPNFILQGEISSIFKQDNKTHKVHSLVYFPHLNSAEKFFAKLQKVSPKTNFSTDGRPTLTLSPRIILELLLETDERAFLVPAHIFTPWLSIFGEKSGFNTLEECFKDLSQYIYALETGLSADPLMISQISNLDKYSLISNSDAHSLENLAREVNIFSGTLSYDNLLLALKKEESACSLDGTLEFYAEEGKYYHNGHRNCKVNLDPYQSAQNKHFCPVCNKKLTLGTMYRVSELANRIKAKSPRSYNNIVPLMEIICQTYKCTKLSKKAQNIYQSFINFAPELNILSQSSISELTQIDESVAVNIQNMRENKLQIIPGFDGEYGKIIFQA